MVNLNVMQERVVRLIERFCETDWSPLQPEVIGGGRPDRIGRRSC